MDALQRGVSSRGWLPVVVVHGQDGDELGVSTDYGIVFLGHPNLSRILTHEDFVGHPMRKDYETPKRHILKQAKQWLLKVPEGSEHMIVNIGPSHPAMHGAFRVQALLDGETIKDAEAEIGYMHRNFEKMGEERTYWQIIPYTDRLNYCSSFMNGHGYALAVEKLCKLDVPERAKYLRVVTAEREHLIRMSLRELLPRLDPQRFWQVHRGTVVRARSITSAQRHESGKVTLTLRERPERLTASRLYSHLFKGL